MRDYEALANHLLHGVEDHPGQRARRIAGVYAALFLDDPLVMSWPGLACFVSLQLYRFLENTSFEPIARGNRRIYDSIVPNLLRFRDGIPVQSALGAGFARMAAADRLARHDVDGAFALVARGIDDISVVEQRVIVQDLYDHMPDATAMVLSKVYLFRMGWDTAAPVLRFRGTDVRDPEQRLAWMRADILPAWEKARRQKMEWLRADAERVRRFAGVRLADLPPRWPEGVPPGRVLAAAG